MTRPSNLARWQAVQREEREAIVGPALDLAAEMRAAGHEWTVVLEEVNRRGMTSRTGAVWTFASLTQAFYKRERTRKAAA